MAPQAAATAQVQPQTPLRAMPQTPAAAGYLGHGGTIEPLPQVSP